MRNNQPITQKTYPYPADQTLISITDTKGRITYCNDDFIRVSGYTKEELLGQPHNILRHPDMPEETFRDFWATIQAGNLWSALIKNRRKDGDSYWVRANATPMRNGDQIVGYLSVRTLPSDSEIVAAEQLFTTMRQEAESGRLRHRFQNGVLYRTGLFGRLNSILHPGWKGKAILLALLAVSGPLIAAGLGMPLWTQIAAGAGTGLLAWLGITYLLIKPIDRVAEVARLLASGDLSEFISVADFQNESKLILPINQLALIIRTVMRDVRQFLSTDAHKLGEHTQEMVARTEQQAAGLQKSATAMEQISSAVRQTSEMTKTGTQIASETTHAVQRSQETVKALTEVMKGITESSHHIGDFVRVIESVAFQTNILALNASVEAARAGENGRGFAVVASEVRSLSQRTANAVQEIRSLIEESGIRIAQGGKSTEEVQTRMNEVVTAVTRQSQILQEIDLAAQEQTGGIQEVSSALQQLDQITHHNAQMAEDLAGVSKNMNRNADASLDNIRVFRLSTKDVTHAETDAVALRRAGKQALALTA
ncbi:methyl-accepting chemotaxis protein [Castellaniella sp.]|uniref:methyl-accepting chemotaxis protein n=1 Tax=Castellaniella sp. TaxID=1955812 RepID=UPI002AFE050D|nr:methyl-accepting chemotaxis protein [Castellaniella sp.]